MALPIDYQTMNTSMLVEALIDASGDRGILMVSDSPNEELREVQAKIDTISAELMRRMAW